MAVNRGLNINHLSYCTFKVFIITSCILKWPQAAAMLFLFCFFFTHYTSGADFVHRPIDANGSVNYCLYHKACPPSILCCLWARGFELWRINSRAKADLLAFTPAAQISWTGVQLPRRGSRGHRSNEGQRGRAGDRRQRGGDICPRGRR